MKFQNWPSWVQGDRDKDQFAAYWAEHGSEMIERFPEAREFYESRLTFVCQYLLTKGQSNELETRSR